MIGRLNQKTICILVAHEFEDVELLYPVLRLSEEGASIVIATLPKSRHFHTRPHWPEKPITGRFGSTVPIVVLQEGKRYRHVEIDSIAAGEFDAIVIPGGFSPDNLRTDPATLGLIAEAHRLGKAVAAICHGPQVLVSVDRVHGTDLVRGRNVTAFLAARDDLLNAGAEYLDVPAVRDGNVITGRVPDDLPEFCQEIIQALSITAVESRASNVSSVGS